MIGETCIIIPHLCAIRWEYLQKRICEYSCETETLFEAPTVNLTCMLIDSGILPNISYPNFANTLLSFLYARCQNCVYMNESEKLAWKPFLDLLICPKNYWNVSENQTDTTPTLLNI